ncbi:alkaline D-peptidase [Antricoccus suffuscus]|uniref:Alkaline D-peptidase n=1 Tax=Antricoccus suffuscus TaxID=1629062 RepID=A0A2T1A2M1_9ACTN|nr:serine hydrolase domain-containing protein [Antricoccus suffuscus]PRZ42833.1 alkaline D-peptidase [Antricoccus suffuscus]
MAKYRIRAAWLVPILALVVGGCAAQPKTASTASKSPPSTVPEVASVTTLKPALKKAIDDDIAEAVATYNVPGAVVGIHLADKGDYTATVGVANLKTKAPLTTEMTWPLRSVTKSFVVTAALQLVEAGKLSLDDTIAKWMPNLPNANQITVRQLANMTSGLPEYTNDAFIKAYSANPDKEFTADELIGFAATEPAQFPPGAKHVYTNTNTVVLGRIIEMVTGMPIAQVLQQQIFTPLKLTHTAYATSDSDWPKPHAVGYQPDNTKMEPQGNNFSIFAGSGAMVSTLADLQIYAPALANGTLLNPQLQAARLVGAPLDKGPEYDQYALGIGEIAGWWGHTGEGFGFTLAVMGQQGTDNSVVILMNISNLDGHPPTKLMRKIAATLKSA